MSDSDSNSTFTISDSQIAFAGNLALASTIPGTCISFIVLVAYAVVCYFKESRKRLDRVSFRLLVYTLVFNILFGIAYAATPTAPGPLCNFGAFVVNFTLSFSTFFVTCIAINLQLVLVHGVNGRKMEKYYIIGTVILSIVLNVPTFALHQFGWDEESATCWYKNPDPNLRLRWIIGTQSFWISLSATIETICSCVILAWLYRFQRITKLMVAAASGRASRSPQEKWDSSEKVVTEQSVSRPGSLISKDRRYRNIILRIALYPIVSLIVNFSTVALDLNTTIAGLNTQMDFRLLVLDLFFYGLRPLGYGILAATDPSFINAVRELRKRRKGGSSDGVLTAMEFVTGESQGQDSISGFSGSTALDDTEGRLESGIKAKLVKLTIESDVTDSTGSDGKETGWNVEEELRKLERQL
ncbi:hypothetical protein M422DRAFT_779753 [Sphaerobolus stellatus SS14]|uniref:G-protein coupled receptors family 2 profile 2 domain-containing protein n=1 Tax=Sphaerobolus stellatus (strain SS14) TaxID=990650 RepID=A0A0C9VXF4_SPHS4|nr:hypothetical protein M422DRAFT_779753 [Sphaerobolus stellatus SS14]